MDFTAIWLTLTLALATMVILTMIGLPLAYLLTTDRRRGTWIIEALITLPLVLPPTVLGFYLLLFLGPHGFGGWLSNMLTGMSLPFTFIGILIGSVIANFPLAISPFVSALEAVDRNLIETSYCLGESKWRTFLRITLPLSWGGILTGMLLTFAHTMGEFGVILMLGGNIPGVTRTLSMVLYDDVQSQNYAAAHQTALLLLAISLCAMILLQYIAPRKRFS